MCSCVNEKTQLNRTGARTVFSDISAKTEIIKLKNREHAPCLTAALADAIATGSEYFKQ
jgi:hypothetical protein